MPTESTIAIEFERLLKPISEERPCGIYLRYEAEYEQIRAARQHDDPTLEQGIWKTELRKADWSKVEEIAFAALETRTKDFQIAAWLTEAWVYLRGYAGLRDGLMLSAALMENFWDSAFPPIEGNDLDFRLAPFHWMNEKLSLPVRMIPISHPISENGEAYSFADWEAACYDEALSPKGKSAKSIARVTRAKFEKSVEETSNDYYVELSADMDHCVQLCAQLEILLDERCGSKSSGLAQLRGAIEGAQGMIGSILNQRELQHEPLPALSGEEEFTDFQQVHFTQTDISYSDGNPIRSRDQAYQLLEQAADYLLRTEPHSPVPYLVRRAVAWGHMPLHGVLRELIRNQGEMEEIKRLLQLTSQEDYYGN